MELVQHFAFLISNGDDVMMAPGWGLTVDEAEQCVASSLNHTWHVVEDKAVIEQFIKNNKDITLPSNTTNERIIADWKQFDNDLLELEARLKKIGGT